MFSWAGNKTTDFSERLFFILLDARYSRFICQYLEAEFARIKTLEVEQIKTTGHDIAYYIKRKYPGDECPFEEGDVVGFFESETGDTVIDLLTSENAHEARLAGVISRSAYLKGKAGRSDRENDGREMAKACTVLTW